MTLAISRPPRNPRHDQLTTSGQSRRSAVSRSGQFRGATDKPAGSVVHRRVNNRIPSPGLLAVRNRVNSTPLTTISAWFDHHVESTRPPVASPGQDAIAGFLEFLWRNP
jgi:hypothetical protein